MLSLYVLVPIGDQLGDFFAYGSQENSLGLLISRAIEVILVFAIILSLLYLMLGGINWITAEGKPDKIEKARNQITQAFTGLAITLAAWAIWLLIVKQLLGLDISGGINVAG